MQMKRTLLVVDDSATKRTLLTKIFGEHYRVRTAEHGKEAMDILRSEDIFVTVVDIYMPGMTGFELIREMKADARLKEIPVIVVTMSERTEDEIRALQLGATDFVTMPLVPEIILSRVNNAVEKRAMKESLSARMLRDLTRRANFDPLTGIYNKDAFYRSVRELLDRNGDGSYVLIRWNVERFKLINDLFGKEKGDQVLQKIATAISTDISRDGIYGRLEADHFAALLPTEQLDLERLMNCAVHAFRELAIDHAVVVDAGLYEIDDPTLPVDQMCDRANLALQTINGNYNRHYAYYNDEMRAVMLREQTIRGEMSEALKKRQFQVYLQPVCSLSTGRAISAEALVRWVHPVRGIIAPSDFIPLFEKSGFITELDEYVWEEVCRYLQQRQNRGLAPLPISVNASRTSLYNANFHEEVIALTRRYGVDPSLFKIEITETAYADNPEQLLETTLRLQKAGYAILMDDFGSGYSSLNILKDIPVDTLKIDMKFLQGFEAGGRVGTVLLSVLRMAKWLDVSVVAEGVETLDQMAFLRSAGCDWIQGYCFAKPMPFAEFEGYVAGLRQVQAERKEISFAYQDFDQIMGGNQLINRMMDGMFGGFALYEYTAGRLETIRVNDGYYSILGYTPATLQEVSDSVRDYVHPDDLELFQAACQKTIHTGQAARVTLRRAHRDGHMLVLECIFRQLGGSEESALLCVAFNDITDRLAAEQKIQEEQERYRLISEISGTIVMEWDLRTGAFRSDEGYNFYTISDYQKRAAGEEDGCLAQVHPGDWELFRSYNLPDYSTNYKMAELRLLGRDGNWHWCRITRNCVRDETGAVTRILGTLNDVNEQHRSQQALVNKEAQLQSLEANMAGAIGVFQVVDGLLRLKTFSEGLCRITGFTKEEVETVFTQEGYTGLHPDDRAGMTAEIRRCVSQEKVMSYSCRLSCKDGGYSWVNLTASPMRMDGELKYYGVFTDIEEQHNTSAQLEAILANVDAGITMYEEGTGGRRIYANDRFYQILGGARESFDRNGDGFYEMILPEYRAAALAGIAGLMTEGKMPPAEYPVRRKDGSVRWLSHRASLMTPLGSPRPVLLSVLTDITERKETSRRMELHRYGKALFGVYNEVFEIDYANNTFSLLSSQYRQGELPTWPWDEALGRWLSNVVEPESQEEIRQAFARSAAEPQQEVRRVEYRLRKEGQWVWVASTIIHLQGEEYLVCNLDVTRRKEAERLAAENVTLRTKQQEQERYRIIVEQTGAMVLEWDLTNRSFYASRGYEELESSGEDPFTLLREYEALGDADDGEERPLELRLRRTDGTEGWYRITYARVRDAEGQVLRVIGTVADIDHEKLARLELENTLAQLRTLINTVPAGISCFEADRTSGELRPVFFSVGRAQMLGDTQEELIAYCDGDAYRLVYPEDLPRVRAMFEKTIETGAAMDCTYRQTDRDGGTHWLRVNCGAVPTEGNTITLYCVYTDMEAQMASQRELLYRDQVSQLLLADSDTVTLDYQRGADLLTVNFLDQDGSRTTERLPHYLADAARQYHILPDYYPAYRETLRRVSESGAEESLVFQAHFGIPEARWYRCSMMAIADESGAVTRVIGKCRDITESRRAENRYREEMAFNQSLGRELLSSLRVNLTHGIAEEGGGAFYREPPGIGEAMNDEVLRLYCAVCILDDEERARYTSLFAPSQLLAAYDKGQDTAQLDYRLTLPTGERRWVHTQVKLVKKPDSDETVALYNTWDIQEKKIAQALVDCVVELDYDYLLYLDRQLGTFILYPNPKRETRGPLVAGGDYEKQRIDGLLPFVHPEDRERWIRELSLPEICIALEREPRYSVDYRLMEKDGRIANKRMTFAWMDEEKSSILAARTDITQQTVLEEERSEALRQALRVAEEANEMKDRFLSHTSHEIRTPMNAVIGMSGLALSEEQLSAAAREHLKKIQYAGEYMLTLVNDILDVSRVESGKITLHPAPCVLRDCMEQLETLACPAMEEKSIAFFAELGGSEESVFWMDKARVLQIFANLLGNATKFTPSGGCIRFQIEVRPAGADAAILRAVVSDNGAGMSAEFMEHMFEPFAQERCDENGMGLGLVTVRRLVEAMGGEIYASSEKGKGTTFTVDLPLRCGEEGQQEETTGLSVLTDEFNFADRRILVVEDQPINAEVARKLLKKKLFTVDLAADGYQALECFNSHESGWYSAILMDIRMPGIDGLETTRRIRTSGRADARSVPILAMTGNTVDDDVRRSLAAGMDGHLEKPIQPRQLYQTLAALIFARENSRRTRESDHRIRQQEKIYRLLLSRSNSRIFEYVAATDEMTISGVSGARNQIHVYKEFRRRLREGHTVEEPYKEAMATMLCQEDQEGSDEEFLFRANFDGKGYRWYSSIYKYMFTPEGVMERIVGRIDDVDEKTKRTLALQEKAEYDAVTSLYNRATFEELVRNDLSGRDDELDGVAAFVELDLDNFKRVNDTYGHLVGDELLRSVAMAARVCLRREDVMGRMGGDEFAIWMNDVGNGENVAKKMLEFRGTIREASRRLGLSVDVTASFGVAMVGPGDRDFSELLHRADIAMYQAKRQGKNDCVIYQEGESE